MTTRPAVHVDRTDVALVRELEWNARAGASFLAERVHADRSEVESRRARLESDGVIAGYSSAVMVPYVLGGDWSWIEVGIVAAANAPKRGVVREIAATGEYTMSCYVNQPIPPGSHKDVSVLLFTRDPESTLERIRGIAGVEHAAATSVREEHDVRPRDMDETDWAVIAELVGDGRRPTREIAHRLGLHETDVSARLDRLIWTEKKRAGVVLAFAEANWKNVADFAHVHFSLEVDLDRPTDGLERKLRRLGVSTFPRGGFFAKNLLVAEADVWGMGDLARLAEAVSRLGECVVRGQAIWQESLLVAPWMRAFVQRQSTLARRRSSVESLPRREP